MSTFRLQLPTYILFSASLFLATSNNTMWAWILYLFFLFPCYGIILTIYYYQTKQSKTSHQRGRLRSLIWGLILILQIATIVTSSADCYRFLQGDRCQSNLNIMMKRDRPPSGNVVPHWTLVEDYFFPVFLVSYVTLLLVVTIQPSSIPGKKSPANTSSNA